MGNMWVGRGDASGSEDRSGIQSETMRERYGRNSYMKREHEPKDLEP